MDNISIQLLATTLKTIEPNHDWQIRVWDVDAYNQPSVIQFYRDDTRVVSFDNHGLSFKRRLNLNIINALTQAFTKSK